MHLMFGRQVYDRVRGDFRCGMRKLPCTHALEVRQHGSGSMHVQCWIYGPGWRCLCGVCRRHVQGGQRVRLVLGMREGEVFRSHWGDGRVNLQRVRHEYILGAKQELVHEVSTELSFADVE